LTSANGPSEVIVWPSRTDTHLASEASAKPSDATCTPADSISSFSLRWPRREVTRLEITAGGDVAFATSIDRLSATPKGMSEGFTLWFRVTLGLRKVDGRWLVTHEHESVPFEMDGSLRASVGLEP